MRFQRNSGDLVNDSGGNEGDGSEVCPHAGQLAHHAAHKVIPPTISGVSGVAQWVYPEFIKQTSSSFAWRFKQASFYSRQGHWHKTSRPTFSLIPGADSAPSGRA